MKYHNHEIRIVRDDMGFDFVGLEKLYEVWAPDNERGWLEYKSAFQTMDDAKNYIDSGYDPMWL